MIVCVIQEIMNQPMQRLRGSATDLIEHGSLHEELQDLLMRGLTVIDGCAYFCQELERNGHLSKEEMGALSHQSIINKQHLDFYLDDTTSTNWDSWCVAQGILLGQAVLAEVGRLTPLPVDVVITVDDGGALPPYTDYSVVSFGPDSGDESAPSSTFRFYVRGNGERWIEDERLDDMRDAILILRS
jgi:hypothetical protein